MMTGSDTEQFSLKWNNFHKNLQSGFHSLLQEVDLVDVTLAADGQFVQAHKIVLSVCSPYFKQLFKVNPCKHPIVILKDVSYKELIAILQFMYQGEVNVRQEELATFLKTAELLQVKGLTGNDSEPGDDRNENSSSPFRPAPQKRQCSTNLHEVTQIYHDVNKLPRRVVEDKHAISVPPPMKRLHSEPAPRPPSPVIKTEELKTSDFDIRIPKMETVELDSDPEVIHSPMQEDSLTQLLSGESSHSHPDITLGTNPDLSNVPGVSQDANNQGGPQYVDSCRGKKKLVFDGYMYHLHSDFGHKKYWRCTEYRKGCFARCTMHKDTIICNSNHHNHMRPEAFHYRQSGGGLNVVAPSFLGRFVQV